MANTASNAVVTFSRSQKAPGVGRKKLRGRSILEDQAWRRLGTKLNRRFRKLGITGERDVERLVDAGRTG